MDIDEKEQRILDITFETLVVSLAHEEPCLFKSTFCI